MQSIQNHEELRNYLREKDWWELTPNQFEMKSTNKAFRMTAFINPFEEVFFQLLIKTPHRIEEERMYYVMSEKEQPVKEEVESEVETFKQSLYEWEKESREKEKADQKINTFLSEHKAKYMEGKGCYKLSFENGRIVYLFKLTGHSHLEIIVPSNQKQTQFTNKKMKMNEKDLKKLFDWMKEIGENKPFLDGWVKEESDESYQQSYWSKSFEEGKGKHFEKAIHYKEILESELTKESIRHVIPFLYNADNEQEDVIEFEISKEKPYLETIRLHLFNMLEELANKYVFFVLASMYSYMDVYRVDLHLTEEKEFRRFAKELSEELDKITKQKV